MDAVLNTTHLYCINLRAEFLGEYLVCKQKGTLQNIWGGGGWLDGLIFSLRVMVTTKAIKMGNTIKAVKPQSKTR